jgi:hypothetical protein
MLPLNSTLLLHQFAILNLFTVKKSAGFGLNLLAHAF